MAAEEPHISSVFLLNIVEDDFLKLSEYNAVFIPFSLNKDFLEREFSKIYKMFYFRRRIIKNHILKMKEPSLFREYIRGFITVLKLVV